MCSLLRCECVNMHFFAFFDSFFLCVCTSMKRMPTCYSCPVQAEGFGSRQNASVFFPLPGDLDVEE